MGAGEDGWGWDGRCWGEPDPCPQPIPKLRYKIHRHPNFGLQSNWVKRVYMGRGEWVPSYSNSLPSLPSTSHGRFLLIRELTSMEAFLGPRAPPILCLCKKSLGSHTLCQSTYYYRIWKLKKKKLKLASMKILIWKLLHSISTGCTF